MKKVKGYFLLILANFLIFITLSISFFILIHIILPAIDIDIRGAANNELLLWSIVIGFGGSFMSLAFSKQFARATLQAVRVTYPRSSAEQIVYFTIEELARTVDIQMPEVWIYESSDVNAFATGPTKNNAMVAVSTGLLENMDEQEVRAVLAHEIGHVFNGDMFTITILMGLMNTFVYFISRLVLEHLMERSAWLAIGTYIFLQTVLSFLAMIPICWYSRQREFEADRFAAKKYGPEAMTNALKVIGRFVHLNHIRYSTQDALGTMKISGNSRVFFNLFATHPPIEARMEALRLLK